MTQATAKERILDRLRKTAAGEDVESSYAAIARSYVRAGQLSLEARLELFRAQLKDYGAAVVEVADQAEIGSAVERILKEAGESRLLVPPAMDSRWLPSACKLLRDESLTIEQVAAADAALTGCELAIADTGTIVLRHAENQGRRVLTLLPDHHVCVVLREQVVESVPEAVARLGAESGEPLTTISGPSATSDIEMIRISGVHGPRRLSVILV